MLWHLIMTAFGNLILSHFALVWAALDTLSLPFPSFFTWGLSMPLMAPLLDIRL